MLISLKHLEQCFIQCKSATFKLFCSSFKITDLYMYWITNMYWIPSPGLGALHTLFQFLGVVVVALVILMRSGINKPVIFPKVSYLLLPTFVYDGYSWFYFKDEGTERSWWCTYMGRARMDPGLSHCSVPSSHSCCPVSEIFLPSFLTPASGSAYCPSIPGPYSDCFCCSHSTGRLLKYSVTDLFVLLVSPARMFMLQA